MFLVYYFIFFIFTPRCYVQLFDTIFIILDETFVAWDYVGNIGLQLCIIFTNGLWHDGSRSNRTKFNDAQTEMDG